MAFAAVPSYLPANLMREASPGLRFGMYLPIWGENLRTKARLWGNTDIDFATTGREREEREVSKVNKRSALDHAIRLSDDDRDRSKAFRDRQRSLALPSLTDGSLLRIEGISTAPFTTGLGNEHPLENGFSFLAPYGLPYLPGSGVKGVLRSAARELEWSDGFIDVLFGGFSDSGFGPLRGALCFWDVVPEIYGGRLLVEVMTPHSSHYYAPRHDDQQSDSPHDSGEPNPIFFLTVPPGSLFSFNITCDRYFLQSLAHSRDRPLGPDVAKAAQDLVDQPERWKPLLREAIDLAFDWLGFGAKTAVGYGAIRHNEAEQRRTEEWVQREREKASQKAARHGKSTAQLLVLDFISWCEEKERNLRGRKSKVGEEPFQKAQELAKISLDASWSEPEREEAILAIESWAVRLIAIDLKDLRKRLVLGRAKRPS